MTPRWLTTDDVARELQVDVATVRRWCRQGHLESYALPGSTVRRIPGDAIDAMMRGTGKVIQLRKGA